MHSRKFFKLLLTGEDPSTVLPPGSRGEVLLQAVLSKIKAESDIIGGHTTQLAQIAPLSGTSDPTTSTVGVVGQRYLNTTSGAEFACTAVSGSVYTWMRRPMAGSLALIETITLAEAVNAVTPANIGSNIYDELLIEYVGTASIATPSILLRNASDTTLGIVALTGMTATRYVSIKIERMNVGATGIGVIYGSSAAVVDPYVLYRIQNNTSNAPGIAGFKLMLASAATWSSGGVFKIYGRKWAL